MNYEDAMARLQTIHERMSWIGDQEERAVWLKGLAASGVFEEERDKLIEDTEKILDALRSAAER